MRMIHNVKGISQLLLIILLLISFILGALLSYIWTMGYYAPQEFHLPSKANITIEKVDFDVQNATFFNVTILNPSYSQEARIEQIMVSTDDGSLHEVTSTLPNLPRFLAPGDFQTFQAYWEWANYAGQTLGVIAFVKEGSGPTLKVNAPFMTLTIASVDFDPAISATNFTVTVQSMGSEAFMNISGFTLNGESVTALPSLPYTLDVNASASFTLTRPWSNLQGKTATLRVVTLQGFSAEKSVTVPEVVSVSNVVFNATDTNSFNITVQNVAEAQISLNISQIKVDIEGETVTIETVVPALPYLLQPDSEVLLTCSWNWSSYLGKGAEALVTVSTKQGFSTYAEASLP